MSLTIAIIACSFLWFFAFLFMATTFAGDRTFLSGDGFVVVVVSIGFLIYAWVNERSDSAETVMWLAVGTAAFAAWVFYKDMKRLAAARKEYDERKKKEMRRRSGL